MFQIQLHVYYNNMFQIQCFIFYIVEQSRQFVLSVLKSELEKEACGLNVALILLLDMDKHL